VATPRDVTGTVARAVERAYASSQELMRAEQMKRQRSEAAFGET
jgi:hypothetical protein